MAHRLARLMLFTLAGLAFLGIAGPAPAGPNSAWWTEALKTAEDEGYRLIEAREVRDLFDRRADLVAIDTRTPYEFRADHIKGAVNVEFHLGHQRYLPPTKATEFKAAVGADLDRTIVIYCRGFR